MPNETIEELKKKISLYETNGAARLFYALNRKMNEMADVLNNSSLTNLDLTDPKDKTFERLKVVWNDASNIANAVKTLGEVAKVTNDEEKDTQMPVYKITTPENVANALGNSTGQRS